MKLSLLQDPRADLDAAFTGADGDIAVAREQYHKAHLLISETRGKFYDRITLLSSGAIVLSISFLSVVTGKSVVHAAAALVCAWSLLVVCILCCVLRNPPFHKFVLHSYGYYFSLSMFSSTKLRLAMFQNVNSEAFPMNRVSGIDRQSEEDIKKELAYWDQRTAKLTHNMVRFHRHYRVCELSALSLFFAGLFVLGAFILINTLSNPHLMIK